MTRIKGEMRGPVNTWRLRCPAGHGRSVSSSRAAPPLLFPSTALSCCVRLEVMGERPSSASSLQGFFTRMSGEKINADDTLQTASVWTPDASSIQVKLLYKFEGLTSVSGCPDLPGIEAFCCDSCVGRARSTGTALNQGPRAWKVKRGPETDAATDSAPAPPVCGDRPASPAINSVLWGR